MLNLKQFFLCKWFIFIVCCSDKNLQNTKKSQFDCTIAETVFGYSVFATRVACSKYDSHDTMHKSKQSLQTGRMKSIILYVTSRLVLFPCDYKAPEVPDCRVLGIAISSSLTSQTVNFPCTIIRNSPPTLIYGVVLK